MNTDNVIYDAVSAILKNLQETHPEYQAEMAGQADHFHVVDPETGVIYIFEVALVTIQPS